MIAVSNTTPLRYLISIGHENLLGQLFEKVLVPVAVYEEFSTGIDNEAGRWMALALFEGRPVLRQCAGPSPPAFI